MAAQTNGSPPDPKSEGGGSAPDPKSVGNAFIEQYYPVLHSNPTVAHRFYHEESQLGRPGPDGQMISVTTLLGINEKILSLDYEKYKIEILTADAQASHEGGVQVLVTGCLMGEDNIRRIFTQSFFLAPQKTGGYFVLNDIFRYVEGESPLPVSPAERHEELRAVEAPPMLDPEPAQIVDPPVEVETPLVEEIVPAVENGEESADGKEIVVEPIADSSEKDDSTVAVPVPDAQVDAPKKSFASIVSALNDSAAPFQMRAPVSKPVARPRASTAPKSPVPNESIPAEKSEIQPVKRHSIFVGNLPLDATPDQLETAFKKFGSIKPNGIQVRSSKGSCYGFVEFEAESSMQSALEENSIMIGTRKAHIEEQKKDGGDRKATQGRGGFRNDHFRSHGGFPDRKPDFSGRSGGGGGGAGRNSGTFQRGDYQNGGGRGPRPTPKPR
ncbi:nuclear transport factor 2 [Eucalyptus grandis]|uniref:nuclear transport factor 2 n=1 Tax=Eucalyptus grandis TaxID=71139 RepID=UPI00192EA69F|nr:nuclear transport factor 2 [Eucalyptus grandis]